MGCDQNFRESKVNIILLLTISVKYETCEWQFSQFIVILREKLVPSKVISREINEITKVWWEQEFMTLKHNMILWNVENCFQAWFFLEHEFTDPSLVYNISNLFYEQLELRRKRNPKKEMYLNFY